MKDKACPHCQGGIMFRGRYGWWCRLCDTFETDPDDDEMNTLFDLSEFEGDEEARAEIDRRADATRVEILAWLISQEGE